MNDISAAQLIEIRQRADFLFAHLDGVMCEAKPSPSAAVALYLCACIFSKATIVSRDVAPIGASVEDDCLRMFSVFVRDVKERYTAVRS